MEPIRRTEDGELCGHVAERDGTWIACTVFGAVLAEHPTRDDAVADVLAQGLASLAERWTLRRDGADDEIVCIQEANPESVTVALGYYSMPGVPTLTIPVDDLRAGAWQLQRLQAPPA